MTYIDRRKKPGLAGRKPSQYQLHFRFEANLDYIRPSEKSLRERITDNDFRLNIQSTVVTNIYSIYVYVPVRYDMSKYVMCRTY